MLVVVEGRMTWFFFQGLVLFLGFLPRSIEAGQRDEELVWGWGGFFESQRALV